MTDPHPVTDAMAQMRAWLADGTISLEQIMCIASEALDEIERTDRPTDPEFWMDTVAFVERMNEMSATGDNQLRQHLRDQYRLKWIPVGIDFDTVVEYAAILDMSDEDRDAFAKSLTPAKFEIYAEFEAARAMYKPPQDREPGSITPEKVAAYPDRYGSGFEATGDEYGPASIKVLAGMEPVRKRPDQHVGGTTEEYDHFARQVGFATDESFIGRELIENWDHELMLAVDKIGPNFLYDRTAAEILQVAGLIALSLAGHFQLEIKKDRELTNIEAAWYLSSYPVLVTRHIEAGSLKSLRLSDLAPFKIEQDRIGRLITEINDELAYIDEPTEGPKP